MAGNIITGTASSFMASIQGFLTQPGAPNVGGAMQAAGGAVSDLFKAQGDRLEAKSYGEAQVLAEQQKEFTKQSTQVQQTQEQRQVQQTLGAQQAEVGAAGFASSGSSLDLLKSSASQGALAHQMIGQQGAITEASQQEQADAYGNMKKAALNAATGDTVSGIIGIATTAAKIFGF